MSIMPYRVRRLARPLAGVMAITLAALGLGPVATPLTPTAHSTPIAGPSITSRRTFSKHWRGSGTLVALHDAQRTGDLALADGTLIPLRFPSRAQEKGLRDGDQLTVSADAHGHARLLVRSLFSKHWRSGRLDGSSKHWRVRGVVARLLDHDHVEVLGVNGAAVVVRVAGARVDGAVTAAHNAASSLFAPALASAASLDRARALRLGEAIDAQVMLGRTGVMSATSIRVIAARVTRIDVEGTVAHIDRATGTVTIVDENGVMTVIGVGAAVTGYRVGQGVEASGAPAGTGTLRAREVEHEPTPSASAPAQQSGGARPAATATAVTTPVVTSGDGSPVVTGRGNPTPQATAGAPATVVTTPRAMATGTPALGATALPIASPPPSPTAIPANTPAMSTTDPPPATATNAPTTTATRTPAAMVITPSPPMATVTRTGIPKDTQTETPKATATGTPSDDDRRGDEGAGTPTPTPTGRTMVVGTATRGATQVG